MNTDLISPVVSPTVSHPVQGRLRLAFIYDPATQLTRLTTLEQQPPLKIVRAFPQPDGAVLVHLHNLSGGVLGGDQLELAVAVSPQARAQLTTTSATRIYRSRTAALIASQVTTIQIQPGAILEYLPDPLIPFAGSRYQQHTIIDLSTDAGLFWWETLAPGRVAHGELFAYEAFYNSFTIRAEGRPIAIERFKLTPRLQSVSSPLRLGPYTYTNSFYICRVGLSASFWSALERTLGALAQTFSQPGSILWAVSTLTAHGLVIRGLSRQGRTIPPGLLAFWRAAKLALYGQEAILPRKIY